MKKSIRFRWSVCSGKGWSICVGKGWSICSETGGQFKLEMGGQFHRFFHYDKDMNILIDGKYRMDDGLIIDLKDSKINRILHERIYIVNNKDQLKIEQIDINGPSRGDLVVLNEKFINSAIFKINWAEKIFVENSIITKRTVWGI